MSSIINCITDLFRSKPKKPRREQEVTSKRPQPAPAVAEITDSEAALGLAPGIIETLDTATEDSPPEEPEGRPAFAQHNVEEPVAHVNKTDEAAHNLISGSIEEAESHHPTEEAVGCGHSGF